MATKHYRIHFVASFDQIVIARDGTHAREVAELLQTLLQTTLALELTNQGSDTRCRWNHIEPVADAD
jgi:hypothetical protein